MSAKPPETGGFLDRWSRRKRAVAAGIEAPEAEAQAVAPVQSDAASEPEQAVHEAVPADTAPEEEFVDPPALDTIGADFDLSYWLRQKVPEAWKRQALRQAWSADPAIRNFREMADYDLDYNTPGMAPGYGPLTESDTDIAKMARKIFGEPEPEDVAAQAAADAARDSQPQALTADANDPQSVLDDAHAALQRNEPSGTDATDGGHTADAASGVQKPQTGPEHAKADVAAQQTVPDLRENTQAVVRIRRRGGGAIPT